MTNVPKEPALVSALRMKGADYSKDIPEEEEEMEEAEAPETTDLETMAESINNLKGAEKNAAIDTMVKKLQSLKS